MSEVKSRENWKRVIKTATIHITLGTLRENEREKKKTDKEKKKKSVLI